MNTMGGTLETGTLGQRNIEEHTKSGTLITGTKEHDGTGTIPGKRTVTTI